MYQVYMHACIYGAPVYIYLVYIYYLLNNLYQQLLLIVAGIYDIRYMALSLPACRYLYYNYIYKGFKFIINLKLIIISFEDLY